MSIKEVPGLAKLSLGAGFVMVLAAIGAGSSGLGLLAVFLLVGAFVTTYLARQQRAVTADPWPWPPDFRAAAEALARPIDPTPRRLLPLPEKASLVATVATTPEELSRLIAEKPAAWPWAVFTSVLVQRRNGVQARLRACVSGYQPRPGAVVTGQQYASTAYRVLTDVGDRVSQLEGFMLSPAFKGAFGADDDTADADAIVAVAHRLMDHHDGFLAHAETCVQTPVQSAALDLVADMNAFTLCPLIGYQQFIPTMCARIGEAQELLPYTAGGTVVALDDVSLGMSLPDGLMERIVAQLNRFTASGSD